MVVSGSTDVVVVAVTVVDVDVEVISVMDVDAFAACVVSAGSSDPQETRTKAMRAN